MRDFERGSSRLRSLPFLGRLVYSVFLLFTVAALGLSVWLTDELVGVDLGELDPYYGGAPERPTSVEEPLGDGPTIDLPAGFGGAEADPISTRKLLEVTHFHLFSMPVYLLILSHLYMLSGAGRGNKALWIGLSTAGVALHVAAPWLARAGTAGSTLFYAVSGAALALGFLVMSVASLVDLWTGASKREPRKLA
jgi:hypothetical protein